MNIYPYIFGNSSGRSGISGITNEMGAFEEMSEPMSDSEIISLVKYFIEDDDLIDQESKYEMQSELSKEIVEITKDHEKLFSDYKKFISKEKKEDQDEES